MPAPYPLMPSSWPSWVSGNMGSPSLDALNERQIHIGEVDWMGDATTKAIRAVRFKVNNETLGAGTTLRLYLADLDTTEDSGAQHPRDDGVEDQWVDMATGDIAQFAVNTSPNLNADRTVTRGETLCVVFKITAYDSGSINVQGLNSQTSNPNQGVPCTTFFNGTTYSNLGIAPVLEFVFADGSVGHFRRSTLVTTGSWATMQPGDTDDGTSLFDGDEIGSYWEPTEPCRLDGVEFLLAVQSYAAKFLACVYKNGALVHSKTIYGNQFHTTSVTGLRFFPVMLDEAITVLPGDNLRMTVRAIAGSNVNHYVPYVTFGTNEARQGWFRGDDVVKMTHRNVASGTWYEPHANSDKTWVHFIPLGEYVSPPGTNIGTPFKRSDLITPSPPEIMDPVISSQTSSAVMDAADEKVYMYGELHGYGWESGSKTITAIEFVPSKSNGTGGTIVRVGFEDIDTTTGSPPRGDGTIDEFGTLDLNTEMTSDVPAQFVLNTGKVVTPGQKVGVRVDFSDYSGGGTLFVRAWLASLPVSTPLSSGYVGGAWASRSTSLAMVRFVCSDGSYLYFAPSLGMYGVSAWEGFTVNSTGTALGSGDERGMRWRPKAAYTINGILAGLRADTLGSTALVRMWVNGVLKFSYTAKANEMVQLSSITSNRLTVDPPVPVVPGDVVIVSVAPQDTGNWRLYRTLLPLEADKLHFGPENDFEYVNRVDEGAWNLPTGGTLAVAGFAFYGYPTPIAGTHTISGNVSVSGTPVEGAVVRLIRQADNGTDATLTDENGDYSFSVAPGFLYHALAEVNLSGQRYNYRSLFDLTPIAP